jgi:hypothetical protein
MRRTSCAASLLAIVLAAPPALADGVEEAKALFDGGAAMYDKAHYVEAIQAFEAAYRLAPRMGILFSIAQAHKKQFFFDKNPENLREALRAYREYVEKTPTGGRRAEAVTSIAELEPYTARYDMAKVAAQAAASKAQTTILVQANAPGIEVSVDNQKSADETMHWPVKAGKHVVRASAPGYAPQEQEVTLTEGEYRPVVFTMKEIPARLMIETLSGAQVSVDGRLIGSTPLLRPLDLDPGTHLVTVAKNGFKAYSAEIEFHHGEGKTVALPLARTGQRYLSFVAFGAGLASAGVGGVFAGLAFHEQVLAQNIITQRQGGLQNTSQVTQYSSELDSRETDKKVAGVCLGGALVAGATGLLLFAFDAPVIGPPQRSDDKSAPPVPTLKPTHEMEMSFVPAVTPGFAGGAVVGRF